MASPLTYFRQVQTELKKVTWPNRSHTFQMTLLVIVASLVVGLYIGGLDLIFQKIMAVIIN